jgi:hypothetical protein
MIYLTKGQPLYDNPGIVVCDNTGYYEDGSSVLCAMAFAPDEPVSRFEAKFIAFGPMVYNISEPEKLLEEIQKIDPQTLFGKNSAEIKLDKAIEKIQTVESEENNPSPAEEAPSDVADDSEENNQIIPDPAQPEPTPSQTPEVVDLATSTVPVSSTTPVIDADIPSVASTTDPVIPVVEEVVPVLENVIDQLSDVSETIEQVVDTTQATGVN